MSRCEAGEVSSFVAERERESERHGRGRQREEGQVRGSASSLLMMKTERADVAHLTGMLKRLHNMTQHEN